MERGMKDKRKGDLSSGMEWKGNDWIVMIVIFYCARWFIANRGGDRSSYKTAMQW